jgi:cell wall-associated NlpC family hydrolase
VKRFNRIIIYGSITIMVLAGIVVALFFNSKARRHGNTLPVIIQDSLVNGRPVRALRLADSVVAFAEKYIGTPYYYTGKCAATGFDCSGFTSFVYGHYGISISPASKEQIMAGKQIPLSEADKGDLLIFTGTNAEIREPGHVGIVITQKGQPVYFIHSSSSEHDGGVKISQLDSTRYKVRFLQVRRVIN